MASPTRVLPFTPMIPLGNFAAPSPLNGYSWSWHGPCSWKLATAVFRHHENRRRGARKGRFFSDTNLVLVPLSLFYRERAGVRGLLRGHHLSLTLILSLRMRGRSSDPRGKMSGADGLRTACC
jgi:hypothetical protein